MSMLSLIASFGGGAFGAAVGALPAFIMAGIVAIVGTGITLAGGADILTGNIAFGSFLGPHIAFAGGFAATAFAARKYNNKAGEKVDKKVINGADITYSLNGTMDASVLMVGGLFGCLGFLIKYLYSDILALQTDTVAMSVVTLGIIVRLSIGRSGLFGEGGKERKYLPESKSVIYTVVIGLVVGIAVSYTAAFLEQELKIPHDIMLAGYPALCFGLSALSLIFVQMGFSSPATHHITLPSANAVVLSGSPLVGIVVAIICSVLGDIFAKSINSDCDSHIDPPACTIFLVTFILFMMFG